MAEDAHDNELFLESIVENIPNMIFVKEAGELRFVRFNRAGEELLGYSRADLMGKNDHDFFPEEQAAFFTAKDREVLDGGTLVDIPEEPIETAGGRRWLHTMKIPILDEDGTARFLLGISEDITQRKQRDEALERRTEQLAAANRRLEAAQGQLEARERQLRFLLEHLPGVYWTASRDGTVTSISGADQGSLGAGGVGASVEALLGADGVEAHRAAAEGTEGTLEFQQGDKTYEARVAPLVGGGSAGIALDVTARRKLEAERLQSRLRETQKLEVLGVLAGGIAHDFNNLLVSMLGHASLAALKLPLDSPARDSLSQVEASAERAADLTRQLLAYSGRGRFVVEKIVLNDAIEDITALLRVGIDKGVDLRLDFADDLPAVEADVAQLRQLIMNLITNASDAIGTAGGQIRVTTGLVEADADYLRDGWLHEELEAGRYVALEVSDTGCGMDRETQTQMFEPFFTTKDAGHGLGLAAALGIVRGHGGTARVYSEVGEGTCIKVLLPAVEGPATARAEGPPSAEPARQAVVLVVDDEAPVRALAAAALGHAGHEVLTAVDGQDAVELLSDPSVHVDVVLLDMTMPRLDGESTFRALRGLRPDLRVVLSSGYNEQDTTSRFVGKGLAGFLQKPYRAADLIGAVAEALR